MVVVANAIHASPTETTLTIHARVFQGCTSYRSCAMPVIVYVLRALGLPLTAYHAQYHVHCPITLAYVPMDTTHQGLAVWRVQYNVARVCHRLQRACPATPCSVQCCRVHHACAWMGGIRMHQHWCVCSAIIVVVHVCQVVCMIAVHAIHLRIEHCP